jgi:hypothetical protein
MWEFNAGLFIFQVRTSCQQSASSAKREEEGQVFYSPGTMAHGKESTGGTGMWDGMISFRTRCFKGVAPHVGLSFTVQGQPEDWLNLSIPYGTGGSILQASMRGREADMPLARCRLKRMW